MSIYSNLKQTALKNIAITKEPLYLKMTSILYSVPLNTISNPPVATAPIEAPTINYKALTAPTLVYSNGELRMTVDQNGIITSMTNTNPGKELNKPYLCTCSDCITSRQELYDLHSCQCSSCTEYRISH